MYEAFTPIVKVTTGVARDFCLTSPCKVPGNVWRYLPKLQHGGGQATKISLRSIWFCIREKKLFFSQWFYIIMFSVKMGFCKMVFDKLVFSFSEFLKVKSDL